MNVEIPELSLVVLVGVSGSGKSTFAARHFAATEVISSDVCRGLVSDDPNDQSATPAAFELVHFLAEKRLEGGRLTVIDATNVQSHARAPLVSLARKQNVLPVALVLDVPEKVCQERNKGRTDRDFAARVIKQQTSQLKRSLKSLKREGFRQIHVCRSVEEVEAVTFERTKLWNDRREDHGPFDIIGDIHGCFDELVSLLEKLGYQVNGFEVTAPENRKAVFVGDLVDRGPASPQVVRLVMGMVAAGTALCVAGNHEEKLRRKLAGKKVKVAYGLAETLEQLEAEPPEFLEESRVFMDSLISHYVLDDGKLVVSHAGLTEKLQGRASRQVRSFCLWGETTGETDEYGLPVRYEWANDYRGKAMVVYGHTPVPRATWVNGTICLDTGCVFGGELTALRYPERELVSVPAERTYYEPVKPLGPPERPHPDQLDLNDVTGKRIIDTRYHPPLTLREEHSFAALEVMSRFAVDPRLLLYLPPTMSPPETASEGEFLEHPREAFSYFRTRGLPRVICQEKHMGSRAIVLVGRTAEAIEERFGLRVERGGVIVTRTGRPFFRDGEEEASVLDRTRAALDATGAWEQLGTDWILLDAELLPWSAKAGDLVRSQYAAVGRAAHSGLAGVLGDMQRAADRGGLDPDLLDRTLRRQQASEDYVEAYRRYCWRVDSPADLRLAPFHILASEGQVHIDKPHPWHLETIRSWCQAAPEFLHETASLEVDLADEASEKAAIEWWLERTTAGSEGMVVKPLDWIVRGRKGLVQPAIKCRGREYLRIIYGPEYTEPENLERLRSRSVGRKRSLALREFALGLEALHRFVDREPLYRVHECVFGILGLETEPVDPRL